MSVGWHRCTRAQEHRMLALVLTTRAQEHRMLALVLTTSKRQFCFDDLQVDLGPLIPDFYCSHLPCTRAPTSPTTTTPKYTPTPHAHP
jgi:hypothetical protein